MVDLGQGGLSFPDLSDIGHQSQRSAIASRTHAGPYPATVAHVDVRLAGLPKTCECVFDPRVDGARRYIRLLPALDRCTQNVFEPLARNTHLRCQREHRAILLVTQDEACVPIEHRQPIRHVLRRLR